MSDETPETPAGSAGKTKEAGIIAAGIIAAGTILAGVSSTGTPSHPAQDAGVTQNLQAVHRAATSYFDGVPKVPRFVPTATSDEDRDGVPNMVDRCPGTERGRPVAPDGCPALPAGMKATVILVPDVPDPVP
jgi:hypothetical protein